MTKPSDYKHIAAWGKYLGSDKWFIEDEQRKAAEQGAPINAIYAKSGPGGVPTGEWSTADTIANPSTMDIINKWAERL
jgi:hypothetical protein